MCATYPSPLLIFRQQLLGFWEAHLAIQQRFPGGVDAAPFFQKRIPDSAPEWLQTTTVTFPSGRTARELLPNDAATLVWGVNTDADLFLKDEFAVLEKSHPGRFETHYVVSNPEEGSKYAKGYVTRELLERAGLLRRLQPWPVG